MKNQFDIKILRQHWVKDDGEDDKYDLCAHGEAYLRIGEEEISTAKKGSWTLSATALYLMRTLNTDYKIGQYGSQLLPCCGHFLVVEADGTLAIIGCPNGIDWRIEHIENNQIKHTSISGSVAIIDKEYYRELVLEFVNKVEAFYEKSRQKEMPKDQVDRQAYEAFWEEWRSLKKAIS